MLTNPLIYPAIIALCTLARDLVRSWYRHRDVTFMLKMTGDPSSLRYLAELEEARRAWSAITRPTAQDNPAPLPPAPPTDNGA